MKNKYNNLDLFGAFMAGWLVGVVLFLIFNK